MTNETKQTAVDYIFSQLPDEFTTTKSGFDIYQIAKEMEKEQIIEARIDGDTWSTAIKEMRRAYAEIYYNETFGGNNEQQ